MARHLMIGNEIAAAYTNGVLADGAIDIQKQSATGPTSMGPLDTIATAPQFRVVQGNGTTNIVSPWIYGKDVINWSGKEHVAQVAEVAVATLTTVAGAAGTHTLKIINLTNGNEPFEMKSYDITVANTASLAVQSAAFKVAIDLDLPHWVNGAVTDGTGSISATGFKKGETKVDGSVQEDLVHMSFVFEGTDTTMAVTYSTVGLRGYGDGYYLKEMEENHRATQYGYYNRLELPNTPALTTVVASPYDMYHIAATKDGSSASQIHGVDNIIELNIAFDNGTAALTSALEGKLNGYLNSAGLPTVNL
tara:strand:- start:5073 stop:5990 length:918 start_codon:yes stop_codon:yes gene_type:complete